MAVEADDEDGSRKKEPGRSRPDIIVMLCRTPPKGGKNVERGIELEAACQSQRQRK